MLRLVLELVVLSSYWQVLYLPWAEDHMTQAAEPNFCSAQQS